MQLSPTERRRLKSVAHHLAPVVAIGDAGLSDGVLAEADRALTAHELIKIRVHGDDRAQRKALMEQICAALGCAPVQMIGKLLVVYRPRPVAEPGPDRGPYVSKRRRAAGSTTPARTAKQRAGSNGSGASRRPSTRQQHPPRKRRARQA